MHHTGIDSSGRVWHLGARVETMLSHMHGWLNAHVVILLSVDVTKVRAARMTLDVDVVTPRSCMTNADVDLATYDSKARVAALNVNTDGAY